MPKKIATGLLILLVAILVGRSYRNDTAVTPTYRGSLTCLANLSGTTNSCSGCSLATNENMACLAVVPEGEIVGEFNPATKDTTLLVEGRDGDVASERDVPYGFDGVISAADGKGYYVIATNRENDLPKSFDRVYFVSFDNWEPQISVLVPEAGFGGYSITDDAFVYVPADAADFSNLRLKTVSIANGDTERSFLFGPQLVAMEGFDSDTYVTSGALQQDGTFLLSFGKPGEPKGSVFAQYLIDADKATVRERASQ